MVKLLIRNTCLAFLVMSFAFSVSYAQVPQEKKESGAMGPRKQMATIIFSGLGGAILGLSTLSFYGRPQDNLANIAVGFTIGIIVGTTYTTYKAATKPYYREDDLGEPPYSKIDLFKTGESQELAYKQKPTTDLTAVGWSWSF